MNFRVVASILLISGCLCVQAWAQCPGIPVSPGVGFNGVPTADDLEAVLLAHTLNTSTVGSVGSATTNVSLIFPAGSPRLCVYGFDLDIVNNFAGGTFWDVSPGTHDETRFTFYADPNLIGDTSNMLGSFDSDHALLLTSDGVWKLVVSDDHKASAMNNVTGDYNYLMQVTWVTELPNVNEANRFMAAVPDPAEAKVLEGTIAGLVGQKTIPVFPNFPGMITNFTGDFTSTRVIDEANVCHVDLWEADFDFRDDMDNPYTTPTDPPFPTEGGQPEGMNEGKPPDDNPDPLSDFNNNMGDVFYTLSVDGVPLASNTDPSGDREWERYTLCSALSGMPGCDPPPLGCTETVPAISGTTLTLDIEDWDSRNTIFFRFDVTEQISQGRCVVVIDQETIDEDIHTIEDAADAYPGVGPAKLVNEDRPTVPATPTPWLLWNEIGVGDMVLLPSGQVDDEGWFAMPENPVGKKGPFSLDDFVGGTIDEHWFDEVEDVMPLRNQDLASLVGRQCVAVVYDSEVNMNYNPIEGKLMGARLGLFAFTVLAMEVPGGLDESGSSTSLFDLWLQVDACTEEPLFGLGVDIHDHEPDSVAITWANYSSFFDSLTVLATSDFGANAIMTITIDGDDD